MLLFSVTKQQ
jgi:hypothetical protein